ncbi:MAG: glycosyltransferase, partial [Kiloniellaceae bacterium]
MRPLKILIVTWYFPPTNTMGALRLGKLAKYLNRAGHDVRVLSARDIPRPQSLPQDFPEERVTRTRWFDVNALSRWLARILRRGAAGGGGDGPAPAPTTPSSAGPPARPSLRARLSGLYENLINFPDGAIGWMPHALAAGGRAIRAHRPDAILASGPPFTTLIVGALLARRERVPWVAEFRDRWAGDPYYPPPAYRAWMERTCERWLVRRAAGLVTVSEPWAEAYRRTYGKPVCTVYNGFDPDDFAQVGVGAPESEALVIVHTGRIYPGRRDPTPLFQAVRELRADAPVRMIFLGVPADRVMPLARACGVEHLVEARAHVPYEQSLAAQRAADILLFMQWNDPSEQGNVPGKLFEYIGARRPVLGIGYEGGVPAGILRERAAGVVLND